MGVIYSRAYNQIMRFNVENRAMRAIEREKPVVPPKHPSTEKLIKEVLEVTPDVKEQILKKDEKLLEYLKDVYVSSSDIPRPVKRNTTNLPIDRIQVEDQEFGFKLPDRNKIPLGQVHLKDALQFITDHQVNPKLWTSSYIAEQYKLDPAIVENVLEYNKCFTVFMPKALDPKKRYLPSALSVSGALDCMKIEKEERLDVFLEKKEEVRQEIYRQKEERGEKIKGTTSWGESADEEFKGR